MKEKFINITGKTYGRLTAIERTGSNNRFAMWLCKCECGNEKVVRGDLLRTGNTKSCGCLHKEVSSKATKDRNTKHGLSSTELYSTWKGMKQRCSDKNCDNYERYGGIGITVCEEWKNHYESFYEWSINNGYKKYLTLDRINVNIGYSPENCRWISNKEQQRNKRNNLYATYNGETKLVVEWCEELNLNYDVVRTRVRRGWQIEKAFKTPIQERRKII